MNDKRDARDRCECGCPRVVHVFGMLRCHRCAYSCWWFRLARPFHAVIPFAGVEQNRAWRLVRFSCGCTRYVDVKQVYLEALWLRDDGWPYCPVCGEDELGDLSNEQADPEGDLYCYRCARLTVKAGRVATDVREAAVREALARLNCTRLEHGDSHGVEVVA